MTQSLLMVAGERSGDVYGGALAQSLRAGHGELEIFGCGGDAMRQGGVETVVDAHDLAMIGITEVVGGLPRAWRALRRLENEAALRKPRAAVLIDFPDFNLRLARKLKRQGIRVIYFVCPQVWAWRVGRLAQLKAAIAKMLCIFDFEEEIYRQAGIPVEYVGHPLVDLAPLRFSREQFFSETKLDANVPTVALLPGSRRNEVAHNLPAMLDAAMRLAARRPIQYVIVGPPTLDPAWLNGLVGRCYAGREGVRTIMGATQDTLEYSHLAVVASGTATLEAALRECPLIVVYRVSPGTAWVARRLVKVPFYSMVNLLAGEQVVPELIQTDFTAPKLAERIEFLLDHAEARDEMARRLRGVKARLGPAGAIARAAGAVWREMETGGASPPAL